MGKQNVTLSLEKELIKKAKILAINHNTSLSKLMSGLIGKLVQDHDEYAEAETEQLKMLKTGFDMALKGSTDWTRDELHER